MIIGEIKRYLRDNNSVRVSRSVRDLAYKALSARDELARLGHEPSVDEITAKLCDNGIECDQTSVTEAMEAIIAPVSLYEPVCSGNGGDEMCVMDKLSDLGECEEAWIEDIALKEAIKKLSDREKNILAMRFYKGRTQMEIAEEIGISQAQVSRLEKSALERIKKQM
ncbi:MAG: sigma-70 family RNA polymerase sigma factor [Firmicutes bacterium]|nr:sigma-70 family RNA polymerase sigma factor [Bacillota bacterium]